MNWDWKQLHDHWNNPSPMEIPRDNSEFLGATQKGLNLSSWTLLYSRKCTQPMTLGHPMTSSLPNWSLTSFTIRGRLNCDIGFIGCGHMKPSLTDIWSKRKCGRCPYCQHFVIPIKLRQMMFTPWNCVPYVYEQSYYYERFSPVRKKRINSLGYNMVI